MSRPMVVEMAIDPLREESYQDPESIDEAKARQLSLTEKLQKIQAQMGDRNRQNAGRRVKDHDYWEWKKRAQIAATITAGHLRRVKEWIRVHSQRPKASVKNDFLRKVVWVAEMSDDNPEVALNELRKVATEIAIYLEEGLEQ